MCSWQQALSYWRALTQQFTAFFFFFFYITFGFLVETASSVWVVASSSWSFTLGNQLFSISSILRMILIYFSLNKWRKVYRERNREREKYNQSYINLSNLLKILPCSSVKSYLSIKITQEICNLEQLVNTYSHSVKPVPCVSLVHFSHVFSSHVP